MWARVSFKIIFFLSEISWPTLLTLSGSFVAKSFDTSSWSRDKKLMINDPFFKKSTWSVSVLYMLKMINGGF